MNIMQLFTYFGTGGAEEHAIILAKAISAAGYGSFLWFDQIAPEAISRLQNLDIKTGTLSLKSSYNLINVWRSARELKKITQSKKIDIVHTHMLREHSVAILAKVLGAKFKLVRTFHRFDQFNFKMRLLMGFYNRQTDAFIAVSEKMAKYMRDNGVYHRLWIINNSALPVKITNNQPALGFMGRLAPEKGIYEFIRHNQILLRQQELVVAGDGPELSKIQKLVKESKLKVRLLGHVSDKAKFFDQISVLVLPSSTEVTGLVILEAFSCGLPVAAFDVGGLSEVVGTENGILVRFADYQDLARQAVTLKNQHTKYATINRNLYRQKFSVEAMWRDTREVYKSLTLDSYKKSLK